MYGYEYILTNVRHNSYIWLTSRNNGRIQWSQQIWLLLPKYLACQYIHDKVYKTAGVQEIFFQLIITEKGKRPGTPLHHILSQQNSWHWWLMANMEYILPSDPTSEWRYSSRPGGVKCTTGRVHFRKPGITSKLLECTYGKVKI